MALVPLPDREHMDPSDLPAIETGLAAFGHLLHTWQAVANVPGLFSKYFPYLRALTGPGALDQRVKELTAVQVAILNHCRYTVCHRSFSARAKGVTDEELVEGMAINFFAQFRICQRIVPLMIAQGGGRIVNVSGQTGIMTLNPPFLSSCTGPAKSAEIRFSKVLANELAPHNIRVNCVIPGFINTPERFAKWEREMAKRKLSPDDAARERAQWSSNQGMRDTRWGRPEEIANLIVFAVSDAASYINGAELVADNAMDKS